MSTSKRSRRIERVIEFVLEGVITSLISLLLNLSITGGCGSASGPSPSSRFSAARSTVASDRPNAVMHELKRGLTH